MNLRVFPRRTKATPTDELVFIGQPPLQFLRPTRDEVDEVHISVTFTWDLPAADRLYAAWSVYYDKVRTGGPAYDDAGGEFVPGKYLKSGYVITSRGCPNKCRYCFVPAREGPLRTLRVRDGWDVADNNLLACPGEHVSDVFAMLERQPQRARLTGGLEPRRVDDAIAKAIVKFKPEIVYLANDKPSDAAHCVKAIVLLRAAGLRQRAIGVYVLVGFGADTLEYATRRCRLVLDAGGTPFAMVYRSPDSRSERSPEWRRFAREWSRPAIIYARQGATN